MSNSHTDFRLRTRFVIKLGRALHHCGATSVRIEEYLGNVTRMLGLHGSFLVSPTTFTYIFWLDDELDQFTHIERMELSNYDFGRLWEIDQLVENMDQNDFDLESDLEKLEPLCQSKDLYSPWEKALSFLVTGGAFAALLSANHLNAIAAALVSLTLFFISHTISSKRGLKAAAPMIHAFTAGAMSVAIPLIIRVPGKKPAVCHSLVELLDLYPTLSNLCDLEVPSRLQGKDISPVFDNPKHEVRDAAFSVNEKGFLLREHDWT